MGDVTVTYSGSTILDTSASGTKTLKTAGKYCFDNITIQFSNPDSGNSAENGIIRKTISGTYSNDRVTIIGSYVFCSCNNLTTVSFPVCTTISASAFDSCTKLTTVNFPKCTIIGAYAFPHCTSLTTVSFPKCTTIGSQAFINCTRLTSLYLTNSSVATLSHSNAFSSTPIGGYSTTAGTFGSIYVPSSLLASYKAKTNWTYFSSRFVGI